ncbi:MAG: enoyl-CoA hydratase/isomerase family protein [Chloroflexota bacterium]|nr:enoyl-CoA hydratase/isomerase family protein [Chloroflexota bacterium]
MTVHYAVDRGRATVRLDRPEVLNALDRPTLEALRDRFREASADHNVGVVVLTGTGERAFCTGADLDEQKAFLERPNDYWDWMSRFIDAIEAVKGCSKPVVARLNGMAVGGGNELNLACDLAVAADDVVLRHVGPSRGSLPAGGATQWMSLLVGDRRAREVLLLNRPITAQQALDWGWLNRVVPRTELDAAVDDYCDALLEKMPEITRATKVQLDYWKDLSWSMTIRMAREWLTVHAGSAEVAEGLASFEEKRPVDYAALRRSKGAAGSNPSEPGRSALSGSPPEADEAPVTQEIHDA